MDSIVAYHSTQPLHISLQNSVLKNEEHKQHPLMFNISLFKMFSCPGMCALKEN